MNTLEKRLGYQFEKKSLLHTALSHSSYINECKGKNLASNERLEFLGDSVLSILASEYLYLNFSNLPEGELTKIRASVVCERALAAYSKSIDLGSELLLGKGEIQTHGRDRDSIIADAFEALIAAVFLDGGMEAAKKIFLPFIIQGVSDCLAGKVFKDYKTQLQEIVQKNKEETIEYVLVSETGPDHCKVFGVELHLNSNVMSMGTGKNKKEAEQMAAKKALELMGAV